MTRPTIVVCALLLAACGDRAGGGAIDGKLTLRYRPPAGAVYGYDVEQRTTMNMEAGPFTGATGGGQQLTTHLHVTQAVTGPVPGGIEVRLTFDSARLEAPGMTPRQVKGLHSTMLFDERQQVVRSGLDTARGAGPPPELAAAIAAGVKAMSFALPQEPVGPGDSWTVATALPIGELPGVSGAGASRTTLTVKQFSVAGGDTTALLAVETTFPGDPIRLTVVGQPATLRLSGGLSGEQVFSLTRGAVVRSAMKGTMRINLTGGPLGGGGKGMVMSAATETTVRLR